MLGGLKMRALSLSPGHDALFRTLPERLALVALCGAYIQGPISKLADFPGAVDEMAHFGLRPSALFAVGVIAFELVASGMVVSGLKRRAAALALAAFTLAATMLALRFWEMEPGTARQMTANAFFEHLGLVGAFVIVAGLDRPARFKRKDVP